MEENKTLEELNQEYVDLVRTTAGYRQSLNTLTGERETTIGNLERAEQTYASAKEKYDSLSAQLESTQGFSDAVVEQMQKEVEKAKQEMENAEALVRQRESEDEEKASAVSELEAKVQKANDRMNLILVSFGANDIINKALVNELEIDYGEKIDEKEDKQRELDAIKTKVSEDAKIQASVEKLTELLEKFEQVKATTTPDNMKKLTDLGNEIKRTRTAISRRMRTLGVKGGKITAEEIDAMTAQKDDQGRYVIAELDRQVHALDGEIGALAGERDSIIESMAIALEMAKDLENGTPEYQKVSQEVYTLNEEVAAAEKQKAASQERLEAIPTERAALEAELAAVKAANPNAEKIAQLQKELDAINEEDIPEVENPRIAEINAEIQRLENEGSGSGAKVETPEYKAAKQAYEDAQKALEGEKNNPSSYKAFLGTNNFKDGDTIIENPDYFTAQEEQELAEENLKAFNDKILADNPDLTTLQDAVDRAEQESIEASDEYATAQNALEDKQDELNKDYITEDGYESLKEADSDTSKAFAEYEVAELAVRKAMLALQKDPTDENKKAYEDAIQKYKETENAFADELYQDSGVTPTSKAMHQYLMAQLKARHDNGQELDEAYNLSTFENRIAIAEKSGKVELDELKETSEDLTDLMTRALLGEKVEPAELQEAYDAHKIEMDDLDEEIADIIVGEGLPEPAKKGFFARLFSRRMPKAKYDYAFDGATLELPEADAQELENLKTARDAAEAKKTEKSDAAKTAKDAYEAAYDSAMTPELKAEREDLEKALKDAETKRRNTPYKINKSALDRLEAVLASAKSKLDATPQYKETEDVKKKIQDLRDELDKAPAKVPDPKAEEDRANRAKAKQEEIDALGSGVDTVKVDEIQSKLADLDKEEAEEKRKFESADKTLTEKAPILEQLKKRLTILEVARKKMAGLKNLIHIKDARKISDRRSASIAQDLADATKKRNDGEEIEM